jgi:NhaP-type Na+/H+ or K+/H+ antiporter
MIFHGKFKPATQLFMASGLLFSGLVNFEIALSHDDSGTPLFILFILSLTVLFVLGWLFERVVENLLLSKGRKAATFAFIGLVLVFALTVFGSLAFADGFLSYAMCASAYLLMSGYYFHFSAAHPEVVAKLQEHN